MADYYAKMAEDPKMDVLKNPRSIRELMMENFFVPFLVTTIKELKCDHLMFLMAPEMEALVQSFKLPRNSNGDSPDFNKLNNDQYLSFRHAFVEKRMFNKTFAANNGSRAMDIILQVICQILCNKVHSV